MELNSYTTHSESFIDLLNQGLKQLQIEKKEKYIYGQCLLFLSNIIMFRTNEGKRALKYCDFYFARKLLDIDFSVPKNRLTTAHGVSSYTAPEMVLKKKYDWLVDVW